jgi:hypothetical protein
MRKTGLFITLLLLLLVLPLSASLDDWYQIFPRSMVYDLGTSFDAVDVSWSGGNENDNNLLGVLGVDNSSILSQ